MNRIGEAMSGSIKPNCWDASDAASPLSGILSASMALSRVVQANFDPQTTKDEKRDV